MRKNQTLILAVVAALGLFLVLRRGGQPEQAAPSAEFGGAADAQYEGGARGVRSNAEIEVPPPPPPESVNKAARAEVARKKAQEKAEHDARVAEKEAALAHALQHAQEMKAAAAEKAAVDKINAAKLTTKIHPMYKTLIREYPFQPVRTDRGELVNVILVRSAFGGKKQYDLFDKYKDEILFIGISSFEDFPLPSVNPFSGKYPANEYVGRFDGFLHMMREPEKFFPPHVKLLLMSQSDFSLPRAPRQPMEVKYDFTFSGSDQDVRNDCVGWSSFAKNWSFVKESLEVMCGEYKMTGVLVATKDKAGVKACTIPDSCKGLITQTTFLPQNEFHDYIKQSRFVFLPQVHDASPRVSTQALALNKPLLTNWHISGGWKYMNQDPTSHEASAEQKTGEFFHDMSDFRQALEKLQEGIKTPGTYEPAKYMQNFGDQKQGIRLYNFIVENFSHKVKLPANTRGLVPSGA